MKFSMQGRRHVLRGSSQLGWKIVKSYHVEKMLDKGVHLINVSFAFLNYSCFGRGSSWIN
ncbi:hypothetical protein Lal_00037580 [Lupinus albus]|nr:hypothetical protein Lal_00037580 [Lupinus albus]